MILFCYGIIYDGGKEEKKMNIAIITDTYFPDINGVTSSIYTLATALRKKGHRVYIFATSDNNSPVIRRVHKKPPVFRIPSIPMLLVRPYRTTMPYSFGLVRILKRLKIDIIHTQTEFSMGMVGLSSSMALHLPIIHTYHTMLEDYTHYILNGKVTKIITPGMAQKYSKIFCNIPTGLIVPTEKVKHSLCEYGVKKPIYVIPTGIDISPFNKSNFDPKEIAELRSSLGINKDDKVLLSLGRVAKEKSIHVIIEQMPKIVEKTPKVKLLVIGDGPALSNLIDLAARLNMRSHVIFAGSVPYTEIGKYYQTGDVFISCSTSETQGLTYYEAMAAGLPVIARKDDAVNELFIDGENAVLFEREEDLPDIVESLFSDEQKMAMFSSRAEETVAAYSAETFANRVEDAYKNTIARHVRKRAIRRATLGKINNSSRKLKDAKVVPADEEKQPSRNVLKDNAKRAYRAANRYANLLRVRKHKN